MAVQAEDARRRDVGCPFCGLVCDDLTVDGGAGRLRVIGGGCPISRERFADLPSGAQPMVDGRAADLAAAVDRAAGLLRSSRSPVFVVAADVQGARAVLRLADRLGGVVDHPGSEALFRGLRVLQDSGALATTLTEVRNRADVVLIVGPDPSRAVPRFFERCLEPQQTLFGREPLRRAIFRLGPEADDAEGGLSAMVLSCAMERLPAALAALGAMLRSREVADPGVPGLRPDRLAGLAQRLRESRYAVLAWAPALLQMASGDLVAQAMLDIARHLNRTTRCAILPLGGGANLYGVNQVCTWQTGFPLRTSFGSGAPEHDLYRFSARRMIEEGEADTLLWASPFDEPPRCGVPTILLGPPGAAGTQEAAAYVPVGMPGADHEGLVFRTDGVVALRLQALRPSAAPDVATVVRMIEAILSGPEAPQ